MSSRARWIGGINPVRAAIAGGAGHVRRVRIDRRRDDARLRQLLVQAAAADISVERVSADTLTRLLPGLRHQGVAAEVMQREALDESGLEELLAGRERSALVVVLDGVQDPHNLGACIRSAEAAGADALVIPRDRAAGITPTVERVAAGAARILPVVVVTNLARCLDRLRAQGLWVVGTAGDAPARIDQVDLDRPLVLVLGGEEKGMRPVIRRRCDEIARIPLQGRTESLNVSVAAGVCLFEAVRQRLQGEGAGS